MRLTACRLVVGFKKWRPGAVKEWFCEAWTGSSVSSEMQLSLTRNDHQAQRDCGQQKFSEADEIAQRGIAPTHCWSCEWIVGSRTVGFPPVVLEVAHVSDCTEESLF